MKMEAPKEWIPADAIQRRVIELGHAISRDFSGQEILCVGILRGSFLFLADLIRNLSLPIEVEFIRCSSYGDSTVSSGKVEIEFAKNPALVKGRNLLIVDDILDAGWTLKKVKEEFLALGAAQLKTCVLLDKPSRRATPFQADYRGFEIPDHFVVGYGMDYQERFRNLPYVGVIEEGKVP